MIVLDTNITSEVAKPAPSGVKTWMTRQVKSDLYLCEIVMMEQSYAAEDTPPLITMPRLQRAVCGQA
ncbi:hypothetical protein AJ87_04505 [Rhizobium yanglingense]|nr:hypothetical protein AJ87_04505 [Rhizobium yanglingense]